MRIDWSNIAEGGGRKTDDDIARFFQMAMGWASEVQYHFLLAHDLEYLSREYYLRLNRQVLEIKRMLASLLKTMRSSENTKVPSSIS